MAITLTTEPADIVASYRPVVWEVTSDRFGGGVHPVSAISSGTGAIARYTNTGFVSHNFVVGDIITGTDFTSPQYNVRQIVTVIIDTETYETNVMFFITSTGTMTKTNDRFQIKADIFATNDDPIKTIQQISASAGKIRIDITNHGYSIGDSVNILGTTSYDGVITVFDVPSVASFVVALVFVADESGTVQKLSIIGTTSRQSISVSGVDIFRFDISNYLQSITTFTLPVATGNGIQTPRLDSIDVYVVKFTEQYDDKDGFFQDKDTFTSSIGDKLAANITLQHLEAQDLTAFTVESSAKRFLTNIPANQLIRRTEFIHLAFLTDVADLKAARITQYNSVSAIISSVTTALETIIDNSGTVQIDASIMLVDTVRFDIRLINLSNATVSEIIQFIIDERCYDQTTRVWWLNRLGGMDVFTLTGDKRERLKTSVATYERRIGSGFTTDQRGTTALGIKNNQIFDVFSDFVTIAQRIWLRELLTSPVIFIQEGTTMIPIISLSKTTELQRGDELKQVRFSYMLSNNPIIQTN